MKSSFSFWKPVKSIIKSTKTSTKTKSSSLFAPKFIQPVNLKKYPSRTKSETRLIDRNPWGDKDKDKVPNFFDCKPMNRKKQGFLVKPANRHMAQIETKLAPGQTFGMDVKPENIPVRLVVEKGILKGAIQYVKPNKEGRLHLSEIAILEEQRGKNLGRKVIGALFKDKRVQSISGTSTNESLGFYKKLGAKFGGRGINADPNKFDIYKKDFIPGKKRVLLPQKPRPEVIKTLDIPETDKKISASNWRKMPSGASIWNPTKEYQKETYAKLKEAGIPINIARIVKGWRPSNVEGVLKGEAFSSEIKREKERLAAPGATKSLPSRLEYQRKYRKERYLLDKINTFKTPEIRAKIEELKRSHSKEKAPWNINSEDRPVEVKTPKVEEVTIESLRKADNPEAEKNKNSAFKTKEEERLKRRREKEKKYFNVLENRRRKKEQQRKYVNTPEIKQKNKEIYQIKKEREKAPSYYTREDEPTKLIVKYYKQKQKNIKKINSKKVDYGKVEEFESKFPEGTGGYEREKQSFEKRQINRERSRKISEKGIERNKLKKANEYDTLYEDSAQKLIDEIDVVQDVEQEPSQDVVEDMIESDTSDDTPYEDSAQKLIDEA